MHAHAMGGALTSDGRDAAPRRMPLVPRCDASPTVLLQITV